MLQLRRAPLRHSVHAEATLRQTTRVQAHDWLLQLLLLCGLKQVKRVHGCAGGRATLVVLLAVDLQVQSTELRRLKYHPHTND